MSRLRLAKLKFSRKVLQLLCEALIAMLKQYFSRKQKTHHNCGGVKNKSSRTFLQYTFRLEWQQ